MAYKQIFATCVFLTIFVNVFCASVYRNGNSISNNHRTNREIDDKVCVNNTPCGWAIYKPFTRYVDFFMKNDCECPSEKTCVRTDDDISISAYIYRCREENSRTKT